MPTIEEFGRKIKEKYPQYQNVDDKELGLKMLEKHPEYKDRVFDTDPSSQEQIQTKENDGVWGAVKQGFKNVKDTIVKSGEGIADTLADTRTSNLSKTAGVFGKMLKPFTSIAAETVATPLRAIGERVEDVSGYDINTKVAEKLANAVQAGMETETARKIFDAYKDIEQNHPEAANYIGGLIDTADFATIGLGAGKAATAAGRGALKAGEKAIETGAEVAVKAGKAAEKTGEYVAGQAFGLKPETVGNIIKNPKLFTQKEMSKIDRESIFNKTKTAIEKRLEELRGTGKEYDAIKSTETTANISEKDVTDFLESKGLKVEDGKIKVDLNSDIQLSKSDASGLEDVLALIKGKENLSAKEVLNLRTRLSNLAKYGEGKTDASKLVARELRKFTDAIAKRDIPGLADLDAKFAPEKKLLQKVMGAIFNNDGSVKDNAISKIANLTGKGKEQVLARMEKIIPGITEDVNILKAIEDIEYAKGQKVGAYMRAAGAGVGALSGGPVGAIVGAIVTSPQVGVSMLRAYGKAKNISGKIIDGMVGKMKSGKKFINDEVQIMNDAVDSAAKKMGDRAKNIKPGMTIEDITKDAAAPTGPTAKSTVKEGDDQMRDYVYTGMKKFVADLEKRSKEAPNPGTMTSLEKRLKTAKGILNSLEKNLEPMESMQDLAQKLKLKGFLK